MEAHPAGAVSEVRGCRVCSSKIVLSRLSRLGAAVISLLCSDWVIYQAAAQAIGYQVHAPVLGAAGRINPWGALADIVEQRLHHTAGTYRSVTVGAGGEQEVIDVENKYNAASLSYNPTSYESDGVPASLVTYIQPPPPNGPTDFGIAAPQFIWWAIKEPKPRHGSPQVPLRTRTCVLLPRSFRQYA
jgi:hypothetical protein